MAAQYGPVGGGQMQPGADWLRGLAQQVAARQAAAKGAPPQQTGITPDGRPIITYTPPQATGMFGMPMPFQRAPTPVTAEVGAMMTPTGAVPNAPAIMPAGPNGAPVPVPAGGPAVVPAVTPPVGAPVAPVTGAAPIAAAGPRGPLPVGPGMQGPQGGPWQGRGQGEGFRQGGPLGQFLSNLPFGHHRHGMHGGQWGGERGQQGGPIVPQTSQFAAPGMGGGESGKSAFAPGWTDRMGGAFAAPRQSAESRNVAPTPDAQTNPKNPASDDDEDDF